MWGQSNINVSMGKSFAFIWFLRLLEIENAPHIVSCRVHSEVNSILSSRGMVKYRGDYSRWLYFASLYLPVFFDEYPLKASAVVMPSGISAAGFVPRGAGSGDPCHSTWDSPLSVLIKKGRIILL